MATVHNVKVEPLTEKTFAPYGQVISARDRVPDYQAASGTRGWAVDFQAGKPLVMLLETPYQGLSFTKLERHFNLTQTFLPMGGAPAVLAVAPANASRDHVPSPADVRAFLLDGTKGYVLGRGTWHSLDRYALYPPTTQWVMITDHETQEDLTAGYAGKKVAELTQEIDFAARLGVTFALAL